MLVTLVINIFILEIFILIFFSWLPLVISLISQEVLSILEPIKNNPNDTAHQFAMEADKQLKIQFNFIFDEKSPEFEPLYWAMSYLSPFHKMFIHNEEKMDQIKLFLEGKYNKGFLC